MLSKILMEYKKTQGNTDVIFITYHSFCGPLQTLEYYVNLHGPKASRWADVYINRFQSISNKVTTIKDTGAFILIDIPTDLHGRYSLMPLCNSQRRIFVTGTDAVISVFNLHPP